MLNDLRSVLRLLRKSPGFALTAILTLAIDIGATTAIFTLVYDRNIGARDHGHNCLPVHGAAGCKR